MKKIEKFSKSSKDIINIKKDFFTENDKLYQNSIKINKFFTKQKKRKKCKNCELKISKPVFVSHNIGYSICKRCGHLNGIYEDTKKFVRWLYSHSEGKNFFFHLSSFPQNALI